MSLPPTPRTASAFSVSPATSPPTSCRSSFCKRPDVGAARLVSRKSERQNGLHVREKRQEQLSPDPHSNAPIAYATKKPWGASKSWDAWKAKSPPLDSAPYVPKPSPLLLRIGAPRYLLTACPRMTCHRSTEGRTKCPQQVVARSRAPDQALRPQEDLGRLQALAHVAT